MAQHRYHRAEFVLSAQTLGQLPPDTGREVAFAGRSNAGKSSVINALTGIGGIARTSRTPGRTQLLNFFEIDPGVRLVDIPGYGYARVPADVQRRWSRTLDGYFDKRVSLCGLILIMDVRRTAADEERNIIAWCARAGIPVHVLLNKADKLGRGAGAKARDQVCRDLGMPPDSVQLFSALRNTGVEILRTVLDNWLFGACGGKKNGPGS